MTTAHERDLTRLTTVLHRRPELRDTFPLADSLDNSLRENA